MAWSDDPELVATFRAEVDDRLASLSEGLLALDGATSPRPLVAGLFRDAHTVKGSARMLGLDEVVGVAHVLEDVLGAVRDGRLAGDAALVDVLLDVLDVVGRAVPGGTEDPPPPGALAAAEQRLTQVLSAGGTGGGAGAGSGPSGPPPPRTAPRPAAPRAARAPAPTSPPSGAPVSASAGGFGSAPPAPRPPAPTPAAPAPAPLEVAAVDVAAVDVAPAPAVTEPAVPVPAVPIQGGRTEPPPVGAPAAPATVEPETDGAATPADVARRGDSVRVAAHKVYALLDGVGEAELGARRLEQASAAAVTDLADLVRLLHDVRTVAEASGRADPRVADLLGRLVPRAEEALEDARTLREVSGSTLGHVAAVRDGAMALAMVPVRQVFASLPRLVRSVARSTGADVELRLLGEDVELDKQVLDGVTDSLKHLVTNAVDHGCEPPEVRRAAGKPARAVVTVEARASGGSVVIEVSDDGAGVDPERLRAAAVERGLLAADAVVPEADLLSFLFAPALSTAGEVTETSGRGVGLDVVRTSVEDVGGAVAVRTARGAGTSFTLTLPVTLGVLRCLVLRVGTERYAVPVPAVSESVGLRDAEVGSVAGLPVLVRGGRTLPLLDLREALDAPACPPPRPGVPAPGPTAALVTAVGDRPVAWTVDALEGELELVVKDLGPFLGRLPLVPGATLDAAGRVVCLLDLRELAEVAAGGPRGRRAGPVAAAVVPAPEPVRSVLVVEDSVGLRELQRVVLAGAGFEVETCVDGAAGAARLTGAPVDLVLTDVEMPGMDGIALTRLLRRTPRWESVPVVIMTSRDEPEFRRSGLEAGADAYLLKQQFDQASLLETVRRLLGEDRPEEEQQ